MSFRNLTWQQVIVCIALLASVVAAYALLGELPAGVLLVVSSVVNLLLGRRTERAEQKSKNSNRHDQIPPERRISE